MRALVIYESMYGCTHLVASRIAEGLRPVFDVAAVPATAATEVLAASADLLVVGCPTHTHRMPTPATRKMARAAAAKPGSALVMDPASDAGGVREWLDSLAPARDGQLAVTFDTRVAGIPALTGRASRGVSRALSNRGYRLIVAPESFLVDKRNALAAGEQMRAFEWGRMVAGLASLRLHSVASHA